MPPPRVEELEQADKGIVLDVNVRIVAFQLVFLEHAAVKVGYAPIHVLELVAMLRRVQPSVEQLGKEAAVEGLEKAVLTTLTLHPPQLFLQIVEVAVKETFLLYEVAEHEAVEHDGRVPLLVAVLRGGYLVVDATDEVGKRLVFLAEARVEVLGDFFRVHGKCALYALLHVHDGGLFVNVERKVGYLGEQEVGLVCRFVFDGHDVAFFHGLNRGNPLLVLRTGNVEYTDVVVGTAAQPAVNALAKGVRGYFIDRARQYLKTVTLSYGDYPVFLVFNGYRCEFCLSVEPVPAHFCDEQPTEIGILDIIYWLNVFRFMIKKCF